MKEDIINRLQNIVSLMETNGCVELSEKLSDAIHYSSTGTELLMKVRYYLQLFLKENNRISTKDIFLIKEIIAEINILLG
jgi:hypothetical protein